MAYSKKTKEKIDKLEDKIKELNDELQNLNIQYKYALFDKEATKREYNYLKRLMEDL